MWIGIPDVFDVINVPGLRYFSTFSNTCFLMSNRSITTSITQSQLAILAKSSSKFPVEILLINDLLYIGEGFDFNANCKASFTILLRSAGLVDSVASFGTMSSNNTSTPMLAKWHAILEPITPEPKTATLFIFLISIIVLSFRLYGEIFLFYI